MKPQNNVEAIYQNYYRALGFERAGLFAALQKIYHPQTVLYPGSSFHLTPSFYFPHLVYIDKNPQVQAFFAQSTQIQTLIQANQCFKGSAYFRFIACDFTAELDLRPGSFDLLLSIFAGSQVIDTCQKYLKPQGLVLTTNLFSSHESLASAPNFEALAWLECRHGKYELHQDQHPAKPGKSQFKGPKDQLTYVDREIYYLYRKQN